jgi:hypothetical protein
MLKQSETLNKVINIQKNGENVRLVLKKEAQEMLRINVAEKTAQLQWVMNMRSKSVK